MFPIKETQEKELKKSTSKEMLQRLPTALVQIKTGNTCENLLNEIRQIIYSLHQASGKKYITTRTISVLKKYITM